MENKRITNTLHINDPNSVEMNHLFISFALLTLCMRL